MEPMLATLAEAPLVDPNLVYEPKYDGIRALVSVVPPRGRVRRGDHRLAAGERQDQAVPRGRRGARALGEEAQGGRPVRRRDRGARRRGRADRLRAASGADPSTSGRRGGAAGGRAAGRLRRLRSAARRRRRSGRSAARRAAPPAGGGAGGRRRQHAPDGAPGARRRHRADGRGAQARGWEGLVAKDARSTYKPGGARSTGASSSWSSARSWWSAASPSRAARAPTSARCCSGCRRRAGACATRATSAAASPTRSWRTCGRLLEARAAETASPFDGPLPANEKPHWVRPELVAEVKFAEWTDEGLPAPAGLPRPARRSAFRRSLNVEVKPPEPPAGADERSATAPVDGARLPPNARELAKISAALEALRRARQRQARAARRRGARARQPRASRSGPRSASPRAISSATTWRSRPSCCRWCATGRWS